MLVFAEKHGSVEFGLVPKHHGIWHLAVFEGPSDTSIHKHTMSCPFLRGDKKAFFNPQIDQFCFLIINIKLHSKFSFHFYHPR